MIALKGKLQLHNLVPFSLVLIYGYLRFLVDYEAGFVRQYMLFMLWYTVAINAIIGTENIDIPMPTDPLTIPPTKTENKIKVIVKISK